MFINLTSKTEFAESSKTTVITADWKREISMRSILKLVIVLVVTMLQGVIEYIYNNGKQKKHFLYEISLSEPIKELTRVTSNNE